MAEQPNSDKPNPLGTTGNTGPDVPVFTCLVYVHKNDDGSATGRVANLAGIEAVGRSERDVLASVTREFKSRVFKMHEEGEEIPWIEPPPAPAENEQTRRVPVHL